MQPFRRILVGVDLSSTGEQLTFGSTQAVEQALVLAARGSAELVFLHSTWADIHEENQAIRPGPSAAGRRVLEQLVERAAALSLRARLVLVRERAWLELIRAAQSEGDLVLVGRHNLEGGGAFLGGVARKLMRKCPCPVWVTKPAGRLEPRTIAAATDLTAVGNLAVELAAWLARAFAGELHVIHAWPLPIGAPVLSEFELAAETRIQPQEIERSARQRLAETLQALALGVEPQLHLDCGPPSAVIRERVERLDADLLVMGSVSRGGIAGLLLGNTAERLLDRVPCSLLTIKPRDFLSPVG